VLTHVVHTVYILRRKSHSLNILWNLELIFRWRKFWF